MKRLLVPPTVFLLVFLCTSCDKDPVSSENTPPQIQSFHASKSELTWSEQGTLYLTIVDPDEDKLTTTWSASAGQFIAQYTDSAVYQAPDSSCVVMVKATVRDGEAKADSTIALVVKAQPKLAVDPQSLNFNNATQEYTLYVTNQGTGTLQWTLAVNDAWLNCTPLFGQVDMMQSDSVLVSVNAANLGKGVHSTELVVNCSMGQVTVPVTLNIEPRLKVNPTELTFGSDLSSNSITIHNDGDGMLEWNASADKDWITLNKTSGTISTTDENVMVSVNRDELEHGLHSGTITIQSNDGTVQIPVSVDVVTELVVTPSSLDFGKTETQKSMTISNNGQGIIKWSLSKSAAWISSLNPTSGTTGSETSQVDVVVDRSGLTSGTYNDDIVITTPAGEKRVNVVMEIEAAPALQVNVSELDFGQSATTKSFTISNSGSGELNWNISTENPWINSIDPSSGTTSTTPANVTVTVDRSSLSPGVYQGSLDIQSNGGSETLVVKAQVSEEPQLSVDVTELNFGATATSKTFNITNTGSGELRWNISTDDNWITSTSPSTGTTTTETDRVTVSVDRSSLSAGEHQGNLNIQSTGGNFDLPVSITVLDEPPQTGEWLSHYDRNSEKLMRTDRTLVMPLVRFNPPSGWSNFSVKKVRIKFSTSGSDNIKLVATDMTYQQGYYWPNEVLGESNELNPTSGWNTWDVDWPINEPRFTVGYVQIEADNPDIYFNDTGVSGNSYAVFMDGSDLKIGLFKLEWAIEVYVEQSTILAKGSSQPAGRWVKGLVTLPGDLQGVYGKENKMIEYLDRAGQLYLK